MKRRGFCFSFLLCLRNSRICGNLAVIISKQTRPCGRVRFFLLALLYYYIYYIYLIVVIDLSVICRFVCRLPLDCRAKTLIFRGFCVYSHLSAPLSLFCDSFVLFIADSQFCCRGVLPKIFRMFQAKLFLGQYNYKTHVRFCQLAE